MKELTLLNFSDVYPDEASCVEALRRFREGHGLGCSRCGCTHMYWDKATSRGYAAVADMRPRSVPER